MIPNHDLKIIDLLQNKSLSSQKTRTIKLPMASPSNWAASRNEPTNRTVKGLSYFIWLFHNDPIDRLIIELGYVEIQSLRYDS